MFPPTRLQSLFWVHPLILCKRKWHRLSNFDQFGWAKKSTHYNRSFIQFLDRVHTFESMTMKTCPMHLRVTLKQNNTVTVIISCYGTSKLKNTCYWYHIRNSDVEIHSGFAPYACACIENLIRSKFFSNIQSFYGFLALFYHLSMVLVLNSHRWAWILETKPLFLLH